MDDDSLRRYAQRLFVLHYHGAIGLWAPFVGLYLAVRAVWNLWLLADAYSHGALPPHPVIIAIASIVALTIAVLAFRTAAKAWRLARDFASEAILSDDCTPDDVIALYESSHGRL